MQTSRGENKMELQGWMVSRPALSHHSYGVEYYVVPMAVPRLSGTEDVLNVVVSRSLLNRWIPEPGRWARVEGQVRSFNNRSGVGSRLVISVLARVLEPIPEGEGINHLELAGVLCKPPIVRRTPLGREICDLLLAVNRGYGRADYLPCIAWGSLAERCGEMQVGDSLHVLGRLQSRRYRKLVDGVEHSRTAYEVSVMTLVGETKPEASCVHGETASIGASAE